MNNEPLRALINTLIRTISYIRGAKNCAKPIPQLYTRLEKLEISLTNKLNKAKQKLIAAR